MHQEIQELNDILHQLKSSRKEFDNDLEETIIDSSGIRVKLEKFRDIQEDLYEVLILIQSNYETESKLTKRKLKNNNSDLIDAMQESIIKLKHVLHVINDINRFSEIKNPSKIDTFIDIFNKLNIKKLVLLIISIVGIFSSLVATYHYYPEATKWVFSIFQ